LEGKELTFEINLQRKIYANRDFIFNWWTDFSSSDTSLAKPLKSREVVSKNPTTILLRDEELILFRRMKFDVKVMLDRPNGWTAEYKSSVANARSEYKLIPLDKNSTNLFYRSIVEPKGFFTNLFSPIIKYLVKRVFSNEMKVFAKAIEKEYSSDGAIVE
jgi:hypothetical protein